jgi:2-dehydropantoate 2-reductase
MQVMVYGAGAVGSLVGARLQETGASVRLIGRKAHVDAIRANGLLVRGRSGSRSVRLPATTELDGGADIILLTVKAQDV